MAKELSCDCVSSKDQWKIIGRIQFMQCVVVGGATGLIVLICNPNF